jgi:hypothetical protein
MLMVVSSCTFTIFAPATLVDVVTGISGLVVVDDAFSDRGSLVSSRCRLGMDRGLPFLPRGFRGLPRGKGAAPRGGTPGLLHGHRHEESSNLITGPTGLGGRWLKHIAEKHGGGDDVLAGSIEDGGFACPILDDATIDIMGSLSSPSATCTRRMLPLEGLLKQAQVLLLLIELGLQFLNLLKLCSLGCTEELGFVLCARELNVRWRGVPSFNGRLGFRVRCDSPSMWKHSRVGS